MALSINILYDGDGGVVVNQHSIDADVEELIKFVERWQQVAGEPCPQGHKCNVVNRMLIELDEIIGGK